MKIKRLPNLITQTLLGVALVALLAPLNACKQIRELADEESDNKSERVSPWAGSGDIIVSNGGSRSVLLLDKDGNFKRNLFTAGVSETIWGLAWLADSDEIAIAIDGVDRIIAVSPFDGSKRDFVINANLSGNLREMTQLASGDLLVVETSAVERFNAVGDRVTVGGWPKTALQALPQGLDAMENGGFVMCSVTTDAVRTYTDAGVQVATAVSGITTTTDGMGCAELASGNIAVAWSGTTDTVQIRNPTLGSVLASFSDTGILGAPAGLAQAANGNILVADQVFHYLVEITEEGAYVRTLGNGLLNAPRSIVVIP